MKFVTTGQTIAVDGKTTSKSRTAAPFTCMNCRKRLHARFDTVVSVSRLSLNENVHTHDVGKYTLKINDSGRERPKTYNP